MLDIYVPYLSSVNGDSTTLRGISTALDRLERNTIKKTPWPAYTENPKVSFTVAYTDNNILLKYYVREKSIRGLHSLANSPVYEDSCLEFFISFDDGHGYYNLEVNCIGTCLFGFGKERAHRELIGEETISKIKRLILIEHVDTGNGKAVYWELVLMIPLEVFVHKNITSLKGRHCKANFYKCGDKLPEPHFLAWSNIIATSPDFHLPEFFGDMYFV